MEGRKEGRIVRNNCKEGRMYMLPRFAWQRKERKKEGRKEERKDCNVSKEGRKDREGWKVGL
jgi:hypothetical protein